MACLPSNMGYVSLSTKVGIVEAAYQSNLTSMRSEWHNQLEALKEEVRNVIDHLWKTADDDTRLLLSDRDRPQLTLLSVMCQERERKELDQLAARLPSSVSVRGYLGDAILIYSEQPLSLCTGETPAFCVRLMASQLNRRPWS